MKKVLLILISFFLIVACASKKKLVKEEVKEVEKVLVVTKDSTTTITKSEPIKDSFFVSLKVNKKEKSSFIIDLTQDNGYVFSLKYDKDSYNGNLNLKNIGTSDFNKFYIDCNSNMF